MEKIGAWIYDPKNNIFKGGSKRAALFELFCEAPEACDLLANENSCLHCGAMSACRFGQKRQTEGPTRRAASFHKTLAAWKERNIGFMGKLSSLRAYNRIFRANGHFYLPYAHMSPGLMGPLRAPLKSKWVAEEDLTTDLLRLICEAKPEAVMGGVIRHYQEREVPKFISDLKAFYPTVFDLLPDDQKDRLDSISFVGRKADITTCAPGEYTFAKDLWTWDGKALIGRSMLFQPVKGEIEIRIIPKPGQPVTITSNEQVCDGTRFLD